jgi:long-chain acyl-CoA synthetase
MSEPKRLFDIPQKQLLKYNLSISFVTKYNGVWQAISSSDYVNNANSLSKAFIELGVKANDKIAIITDRTRTEWNITDIGIMQVGAQNVPIYDSTNVNELEYIFNHAEVTYCFVSNEALFNKVNAIKDKLFHLKEIFSFDKISSCNSLSDLINVGNGLNNDSQLEQIKNSITEDHLATIIYTSGTTDKPKGVMLTHKNILSNVHILIDYLPEFPEQPKALSFLPVSHIFERMMLYLYQNNGLSIYYAESIETISSDINVVKPHVMTAVPRLIEKIHDKIVSKGKALKGIKLKLFNWALELGYSYEPDGLNGKKYERKLARARKLIFRKWQEALGGNIKAIYCGSSKLQPMLSRIFCAAELYLYDGYGLTETSPVISVNSPKPFNNRISSIGKPLANVDVIIAEDGEILAKGDSIMKGYFKDPERTKKVMIDDYFKTGDLGELDEDGFLYITGRKKENFKTSGGKYVNPSKIESELKKSDFIEQVVVIGENEKMPAAIIQPNFELLQKLVSTPLTYVHLIKSQVVIDKIQEEIELVNNNLSQFEKIKRFELTADEWTTNSGHLTPTLKVRKDIIKAKYYILYNKIYRPYRQY